MLVVGLGRGAWGVGRRNEKGERGGSACMNVANLENASSESSIGGYGEWTIGKDERRGEEGNGDRFVSMVEPHGKAAREIHSIQIIIINVDAGEKTSKS